MGKETNSYKENLSKFDIIASIHWIAYPLMWILRTTEWWIEHIPQIIRHQGMDFLVPIYCMELARLLWWWQDEFSRKRDSKRLWIVSIVAISVNEISQAFNSDIIKQSWESWFDYKDLIAAGLWYAYFKVLEKIMNK